MPKKPSVSVNSTPMIEKVMNTEKSAQATSEPMMKRSRTFWSRRDLVRPGSSPAGRPLVYWGVGIGVREPRGVGRLRKAGAAPRGRRTGEVCRHRVRPQPDGG